MKTVIVLVLIVVIGALASAGLFMLRRSGDGASGRRDRMARALALRVGLSIALFLFVLLGWHMGWISPGGLPAGR